MIDQYIPNLKTYRAIAMDIGTKDGLLAANKQLELAMTRFGVVHTYEEYDGDHTNRRAERVETKVLPFFSNALSFTTGNPSSTRPGPDSTTFGA
jgi:S-formylglutathione hydrolase